MDRHRKRLYIILLVAALWSVAIIWTAGHWNTLAPHLSARFVVLGALIFGLLSGAGMLWFNLKRGFSRAYSFYNFLATIVLISGVGALWLFALPAIAFFVALGIYFVLRLLAMSELRKPQDPQQKDLDPSRE